MSVKKRRFSHPSLDCTHWTAWIFLTVAKIQSEFVGGQIVSWQLPPVSRRICQRQRIIPFEGKKNGGLEMSFKTADRGSNLKIAHEIDMYPEFWTHIYKLGGHHGCFSVFYRRHPFCFCLDSFVIIVINIFINSNCKFFK